MALRRRKHAGFTVIEVLVALTLMAMVILLVTRAFLVVLSVTSQGGRVTSATALAAKQLEAIRTTVEAQPSRDAWRTAFCGIAAAGRSAFAAPYGSYEYQVLLNDTAVSARSGQENDLLPCWAVEWSRTGCGTQPGYAGSCTADSNLGQDDRMRWVTVEVFYRSGTQPVARMTTAIMRGAYHR
jgi:prepilin-type N-terminal cleavage/methylation domain-containing protein